MIFMKKWKNIRPVGLWRGTHEIYSRRFPEGSKKRKSNNDDKHDHGQKKRRPSTLCWGEKKRMPKTHFGYPRPLRTSSEAPLLCFWLKHTSESATLTLHSRNSYNDLKTWKCMFFRVSRLSFSFILWQCLYHDMGGDQTKIHSSYS